MVQVSRKCETLDDVDILREHLKISSGEAVLHANVLKHFTEKTGRGGMNEQIEVNLSLVHLSLFYQCTCFSKLCLCLKMEMKVVNAEIKCKQQISSLERQIAHSVADSRGKLDTSEPSTVMFMCTIFGFDLLVLSI